MMSKLGILICAVTLAVGWSIKLPVQDWLQALSINHQGLLQFLNQISNGWIPQAIAVSIAVITTGLLGWDVNFFSQGERKNMYVFFKTKMK